MSAIDHAALASALEGEERKFLKAMDRLRDLTTTETENDVYELTRELGLSVVLVGCLRRLIRDRGALDVHRAFGAPGDFGYETPIGAALDQIYRAGMEGK